RPHRATAHPRGAGPTRPSSARPPARSRRSERVSYRSSCPPLRRRSTSRGRETLARIARAIVRLLLLDPIAPPLVVGFALLDEPLERIAMQACRDPLRAGRFGDAALMLHGGG